jgi:hypothetical protein
MKTLGESVGGGTVVEVRTTDLVAALRRAVGLLE